MFDTKSELDKLADENYKKFNEKFCPDTNKELLGIRIPELRKLAKKIVKQDDWDLWLKSSSDKYFEEVILQGLVIAYSPLDFKEKLPLIKNFVPKIDSWAISDTFVPTLNLKDSDLNLAFEFIKPYFTSKNEFDVRFAVIVLLYYFIIDEYIEDVINILDKINHEGYYVKMAVAWCLAEIGIKYNEKLMNYLIEKNSLDDFTYNKTLQKMIESYRITNEQKDILRKMKRKTRKVKK